MHYWQRPTGYGRPCIVLTGITPSELWDKSHKTVIVDQANIFRRPLNARFLLQNDDVKTSRFEELLPRLHVTKAKLTFLRSRWPNLSYIAQHETSPHIVGLDEETDNRMQDEDRLLCIIKLRCHFAVDGIYFAVLHVIQWIMINTFLSSARVFASVALAKSILRSNK